MKIAIALEYPLMQQGGTEVLVRELLHGLGSQIEIVLVSGDNDPSQLPSDYSRLLSGHVHWQPGSGASLALAERLHRENIQLAHFHFGGNFAWNNRFPSRCPIPYVARTGIPVITTIHMAVGLLHGFCGPRKPLWFKLGLLPLAWLAKLRVLRHIRGEIAVSKQDLRRLRAWYWPLRGRFTQIYHSRIRNPSGEPAPAERERVILNVGHIAERKGQRILAEAFARIARDFPDWRLQFAGHVAEESCRQRIEAAAGQCSTPNQISLLGRRDDTWDLMRRASIYVQPSFYEGLPLSLQEGLFHGCACAATRIPGNTELIEDQVNGLLVEAGDIIGLSQVLARLLNEPDLRSRLASKGNASIIEKEMTAPHMIRKHKQLYDAVAGKA